jgi:hypothetical protein
VSLDAPCEPVRHRVGEFNSENAMGERSSPFAIYFFFLRNFTSSLFGFGVNFDKISKANSRCSGDKVSSKPLPLPSSTSQTGSRYLSVSAITLVYRQFSVSSTEIFRQAVTSLSQDQQQKGPQGRTQTGWNSFSKSSLTTTMYFRQTICLDAWAREFM